MESLTALQLIFSAVIVLVAFVVRGMSGFGSGIVAIPLLALMVPLHAVVPAMALMNYIASLRLGVKDRRLISWRELLPLMPSSIVGILAALYLFKTLNPVVLSKALGVFVIGYALYSLSALRLEKGSRMWAVPAGALGGMIDTLFSIGGPIYVMYLDTRHLDKTCFRATIATFLLLESGLRLAGYFASGFYGKETLLLCAATLPLMVIGMYLGEHIHTRISQHAFMRVISVLLIASGVVLLVK